MTDFSPPPATDDETTVKTYLQALLRATLERPFEPIDAEGRDVRCQDCGRMEGEIHMVSCDMERCPWCGGQLISCGCPQRRLRIRGDQDLIERQTERFGRLLEAKERVLYVRWPVLCARCGGEQPTFAAPKSVRENGTVTCRLTRARRGFAISVSRESSGSWTRDREGRLNQHRCVTFL